MITRTWLTCLLFGIAATLNAQTQLVTAKKRTATITINGNPSESIWQFTNNVTETVIGTPNNTVKYAVLWDSLYLYVAVTVLDGSKRNDSPNGWDDDAIEIYIDADNNGGTSYGINDRQFIKEWNSSSLWEKTNKTTGVLHAWANITGGYAMEMRIPWSNMAIINPSPGFTIGFDISCDDDDNGGARESQVIWAGDSNNWQYPQNFGDLVLITTADTQAPSAPTDLAASNLAQTSLTLNWTASADNVDVTGYDIFRNGTKINSSLVTTTNFNVTGLTVATAYQFYVQAKDAAGNTSPNSNTINVTTPDTQAPTVPTSLAASDVTQTSLTLTWTASTDNVGVTGYDIFQNGIKINESLVTGTGHNVTGLTAATAYAFYIQATDAAGNVSANSTTLNITTLSPPDTEAPSDPANLTASSIAQSSLTLNWDASTDNTGVTGYDVFQNGTKINLSLVTGMSYIVTGLSAVTQYGFYVQAKDAAGNISGNSNTVDITTPDTEAPAPPTGLATSGLTQTSFTLNWNAATDNVGVTGYDVYQDNVKINTVPLTVLSYPVAGLTAATAYQFYVQASDAAGNTTNSSILTVTTLAPPDTEAPTVPSGLAAPAITQSSLTLTWIASTDDRGVAGYDIYQNGTKINSGLVASTSYAVSGLTALTAYDFYVVASDAAGNVSVNSEILSVTTPDTEAPSAPSNLSHNDLTANSLTLNWTASVDNIAVTGYDVYQNGTKINTVPVTVTTYDVIGLTQAASYSFFVKALDNAGNASANSNTITVTTPDTEAPSAPSNLQASNLTAASVTLNWTASADNTGVTGYDVYQDNVKINSSPVASLSYTVNGLTTLASYDFYVVALDAAGNISAASNTITVTIPDIQAPSAPSGLAAVNVTASALTLNWTASTDNVGVTGYDIYQNGTKINAVPVAATTYDVTGLIQASSYSFFVRALDGAGNVSANSNTINVATPDTQAPSAPSNLVSSNLLATAVTISWTASTDNIGVTGYDVYRNGIKINPSLVSVTTYSVTGLTPSTAYSFYIQAKDAAGNISGNSNTLNITTPASTTCSGTGSINFQKWNSISGTSITNLTSNANYPNTPTTSGTLSSFEIPTSGGDNYGMKVYGYICPPTTGSYIFWIAGDDNSELWLSTTSNSTNKQRIAYHTSWTNSREWNKFATQKSAAITLTAGQLYYVEALMKEGSQGDNMAVGWAKPGQATTSPSEVIPGAQLVAQIADSLAPSTPANLSASGIGQTSFTLLWTASTDNIGVAGYDVYRNGTKINPSLISGTTYNVTGLTPATTYSLTVIAKDPAGNSSAASNALPVTTLLPNPGQETFTQRTVIGNQRMPHDLVYGPDNNIWYTERFAGRVSFVNPATGTKRIVLTLGANMVKVGGQDGLMGLALHPQFKQGKPYAYISYTYQSTSPTVRKMRIARYTYDSVSMTLGQAVTILENIPGSNDHNSARLAIGPDMKLYFTVGDMGAGQFDNQARPNNAQNANILEGKVLRLNTESISGSWIPADNPFTNAGSPTAVYSLGHRNPQGLVWGKVNGIDILYSSEHGPYSDDELNIIEQGRNYGWPLVAGFCDGNYNGRFVGGAFIVSEQNNCTTLNAKEPIRSLFPVTTPPDSTTGNMTWPSTAPSGTEFYGSTAIPGWQNSLLVAQLKKGTVTRFKLSNDGQSIISDTIHYFRGLGRFRDVVVSPDGLKIYVACDSSGSTSGPTGGVTSTPANPGSILEFTYQPAGGSRQRADEWITESKLPADVKDKSTDVYPNPASSYFIVYNYGSEAGRTIEMMDLSGKIVKRQVITSQATRIEVTDMVNGLYILKIADAKGKIVRTEKMIVLK
jgi:PQQ-dependent dehydrogenase (s-GDH family)